MPYVRKSVVNSLSHEELLLLVKSNLDALGISYEEKPGGFGPEPILDPGIFEAEYFADQFVLEDFVSQTAYRPPMLESYSQVSIKKHMKMRIFEYGQSSWAA